MRTKYLAAVVITWAGLFVAQGARHLLLLWQIPLTYRDSILASQVIAAIASLVLALSFRLTDRSVRWPHVLLIGAVWFVSSFCTLVIVKWGGSLPLARTAQGFVESLTGQYRPPQLWLPLGLPVALLLTGYILKEISPQIRARHIVAMAGGGLVIAWGHHFIIGNMEPLLTSGVVIVYDVTVHLALGAVWAVLAAIWLFAILALARWGSPAAPAPASASVWSVFTTVSRPAKLDRYLLSGSNVRSGLGVAVVITAALSILVFHAANVYPEILGPLQSVILYMPPILTAILVMLSVRHASQSEAMQLVRLGTLQPIDLFIAQLHSALYRMRWFLLAGLGCFLALSLNTLTKPPTVVNVETGRSFILVMPAWLGLIVFGAALGTLAGLHFESPIARALTPVVTLVAAALVLPVVVAEAVPGGWISRAANLVIFSVLPCLGVCEIVRMASKMEGPGVPGWSMPVDDLFSS